MSELTDILNDLDKLAKGGQLIPPGLLAMHVERMRRAMVQTPPTSEGEIDPMTCELKPGDQVEVVGPSVSGYADRIGKSTTVLLIDGNGDAWVERDSNYRGSAFRRSSLRWLPPSPAQQDQEKKEGK